MVDLHLLRERLFRSTNCVMFLAAAAFLGMLYLIPLYFQDARGLSALQSGLSTFPEAIGVMIGAQFASRFIYPRIGPRRHITGGLLGLAVCMLVLTQISVTTNLWFIRGLMFVLGWMMAQVMVPNQAASFAMITPESMGRASTFFNTMRQVGSATGVAVLSTVLIGVGSAQASGGTVSPDIAAYHFAFLTAAIFALAAAAFSLTIHDSDAAETIVRRVRRRPAAGTSRGDPGPRGQPGVTTVETVCVFCGSSSGTDPAFTAAAERFGTAVAERGIELVYGGASVGLMGVVADAAMAAGGRATGVITESLAGHEIAHGTLSDLHVVSTMHERKALMSELSDAFVMLPGRIRDLRGVHGVRHLGAARHPRQALRHTQRRRLLRRSPRLRAPRRRAGLHQGPPGRRTRDLRRRRRAARPRSRVHAGIGSHPVAAGAGSGATSHHLRPTTRSAAAARLRSVDRPSRRSGPGVRPGPRWLAARSKDVRRHAVEHELGPAEHGELPSGIDHPQER